MAKRFTKLLAALALLIFMAPSMVMWGQTRSEVTYTFSEHYSANTTLTDVAIAFDNSITGTFGKGNGSTAPQYYTNGTAVRWYGGNTLAITASNATVSEIVLTYTQKNKTVTTDVGTYNHDNGTWSGSASSVTFTVESGSGHNRVSAIKVTYSVSGSTPTCATPTFSPAAGTYTQAQSVSISCATEGATVYYTTNGQDPTTNSTVYSEAINVSTNTTIKAMATAEGYDNSAIATAEYAFITLEHAGTLEDPYTVADARTAIDAGTGTQGVYATGIVSAIPTAYNPTYSNVTFNMVDEEGDEVFLQAYRCGGEEAANVAIGDVVVVYGNLTKYGSTYEFGSGCQVVSLEHPVITEPSITVTPATVPAPVGGSDGVLNVTYENITTVAAEIAWYEATGAPLQDGYDWIDAEIDADNNVYYVINANNGEARTAYLKVWAYDDDLNEVYSNLVTIDQDEYVAPTYAELPFAFNSGRAAIEETDGLYQEGLGTDYNASTNPNTQLKFDGTGDWLLLQFNERPGTLTFDIKGNSFSGGTFTVQTSEDGTTYTDLATYTELTSTVQNEAFTDLGENVRYIKWVYTEKSNGNVGLGNITLAEYVEPVIVASITVTPDVVNVNAEEHDGTLTLAYENLTITEMNDFDIQYYNAEGQEAETPDWIEVLVAEQDPQIGEGYVVSYYMLENEGEVRTAYFKVYAMDDETNLVHSNLVTINQEAYVAPVPSITITPDVVNLDAGQQLINLLDLAYENIEVEGPSSFTVHYYNAQGDEIELVQGEAWLVAGVVLQDSVYQVLFTVVANYGEARTAYFKVSCGETYSNLVTVTQAAPVLDYAFLPFEWGGGERSAFEALNGTSTHGVGDYAATQGVYRMKLDSDGDYIMVKTDGQPGVVTIGVKMVGGSDTSTITIQSSADGETFTDIEVLTISGAQNDTLTLETTNAFDADDRYVRMLFTKGSNVGVGPITIAKGTAPSINVAPATFDLEAVGDLNGMHVVTSFVTYYNIDITQASDFHIQFYNAEGVEQEKPEWILGATVSLVANSYQAACMVAANNGVARSAYYRVYAFDADENVVYSNCVTINQAGVVVPPTPGNWVLTDLADLTADDVFVIVGDNGDTYAMPVDGGGQNGAPAAVAVTVVEGTLSAEPAANLQWNISITEDGYTFYPNGETETWLYCTNSNNGVRVGTNDNNVFTMSENGYLHNTATERYIGIYNSQDWRCYTSEGGNIANQTFAFYKAIPMTQTIELASGANWVSFYVDITLDDLKEALLNALGDDATNIKITSQSNGYTYWDGSTWRGTLNPFDVSQMFVIEVTGACEISLEAMPVARPITIVNGTNWIGFPFSGSMSLSNAFSGFAENGDKILAPNGSFATYNGDNWEGELTELLRGQGYKYEVTTTGERNLVFPSSK